MKKWLKSLFRGNDLNEIEEEFDEKPSEARVIQSRSIEKNKDEYNRPNFRFPLDLDEEDIFKEEQTKVEPVFHKQKNYDFWQEKTQTINRTNIEINQTTYKQRDDYWQNNNQSTNQYKREDIQPVYNQVNSFSRNEAPATQDVTPQKVEEKVEEKVDIVFRPKRKTPFRPSEYISPIYGYQKPPGQMENKASFTNVTTTEKKGNQPFQQSDYISPIYGHQRPTSNTHEEKIDFSTENEQSHFDTGLTKTVEQEGNLDIIHQSTEQDDLQIKNEKINMHSINQDSQKPNEIRVENIASISSHEEEEYESITIQDAQTEFVKEVEKNEVDKLIERVDLSDVESETAQATTIELETVIEHGTPSVQEIAKSYLDEQTNGEYESIHLVDEKENTTTDETTIPVEESTFYIEIEEKEQIVSNEENISEKDDLIEIDGTNSVSSNVDNMISEDADENIKLEASTEIIEESHTQGEHVSKEESFTHAEAIENEESLSEAQSISSDEIIEDEAVASLKNEQQSNLGENEVEVESKENQTIQPTAGDDGQIKREKKRHFPFNVMMLRSDVEAARKARVMKQLLELQNETAASLEKVSEENSVHEQTVTHVRVQKDIMTANDQQNEMSTEPINDMENDLVVEAPSSGKNNELSAETDQSVNYENLAVKNDLQSSENEIVFETNSQIETNKSVQEEQVMPPVLYELPELDLLNEPGIEQFNDGDWVEEQKQLLQETLQNFNVGAKVIAATQGPTVTRFEVQPEPGVKVNKITNLQDDIKLSLAARDIRIEAPIPGRSAIGIEVPNRESKPVYLRELVNKDKFLESESPLTVALGLDIGGEPVYADISKMPHGLIAGATGSGKSVCINSILVSILYKAKPHEVKLILIDPKMVELAPYNHIPHLISPVITDARAATAALKWACDEMDRRYDLFAHAGARDIKRFNEIARKKGAYNDELPYLVIVIDELADLMMVSPGDVETYICRIAQKARACGIHLLVATQRPSVDVITGIIKSNIPTRIAFTVSSQVDSRTIIDIGGAEKLLGRGDMLFLDNGKSQAIRLQGVFVSDDEIEHVVEICKDQQKPNYLFNQEELVAKADAQDVDDELFEEAVEFVIDQKGASVSMLQRRFRIGYNRAARLVDLMFDHGIVSNQNGSKPRDVLITLEEFRSE